uniref:Deoxyribose-phosphate aldolase n=1 Tax=Candidatus Kentrum sp. LFY TaxID=2126342 RepID=A0A450UE85_9GAMM|nr:MAG: deoxyribose-phosphate aldolase [Candidatus Kentron sp. LFY]
MGYTMQKNEIAKLIDHTLLRPEATHIDLGVLCNEAIEYGFACVCVNPCNVDYAASLLRDSRIAICSVAGFPFGASRTEVKVVEAEMAIQDGAKEIDMVLNIGEFKNRNYRFVERDVREVGNAIGKDAILKVIIEAPILTEGEKIKATEIVISAGADYVKTATGINFSGATIEDVALLKRVAGGRIKVKAAGGVRDRETAITMIESGADRIGTSTGPKLLGI